MTRSTTVLLASSMALLANKAIAFAPSSQQLTSTVLRSQSVDEIMSQTTTPEVEAMSQTTTPEVEGANQEEEDRVYYKILSEASPKQVYSAGDVLAPATAAYASVNGWVPKEDYALWGLPGAIQPLGYFDPIGFAREGLPLNDAKRLREAEVQHGRVAMLAAVGYLAGEFVSGPFHIIGPANDQLQQVPAPAFLLLSAFIASAEMYRAKKGWVEPKFSVGSKTLWTLRENYYPGDLGFDPLGLKPTNDFEYQKMQTKELSNGRLAMLGWAGMCAQELMNHRTIGDTIEFYQTVSGGGNPYDGYY
jgi:hypothetical protein